MKRQVLFLLIFTAFADYCFSQNIKPFRLNGFYGVLNKATGKILINAKFKRIEQFNDSMIVVVDSNEKYAIIDTLENILLSYSQYSTGFIDYDSINNSKFIESPYRNDQGEVSNAIYIVGKDRKCIPSDYYSCPCWKSLSKDTVAEYLALIQKAMLYKSKNMTDSAKFFCEKAILAAPTKPYVYLKRALIAMTDKSGKYLRNLDTINNSEKNKISECLEISEKLEKNLYYLIYIKNIKYLWYKGIGDKFKYSETEKQIKQYDIETFKFGWFLLPTISYSKSTEVEIGFGRGYIIKETSFKKKPYQQGLIFYGASYSKNLNYNIDGYKLYLLSFIKTLNAGVYPIFYTNYEKSEFVIRFEAGLGYSYFGLNLGYNLHASGDKFNEINGFNVNLKTYIPISGRKTFQKK